MFAWSVNQHNSQQEIIFWIIGILTKVLKNEENTKKNISKANHLMNIILIII